MKEKWRVASMALNLVDSLVEQTVKNWVGNLVELSVVKLAESLVE